MGESSERSAPNLDAAVAAVSPSKCAMIGKREVEDEPANQLTAKKQKRDWVAENQRKSSADHSTSDSGNSDEDSGLNYSKVTPAEGKSGLIAIKKKGESRSDTGSISIDKDDKKTEPTILPEKLPDAGKEEPAKKLDSSKASGLDSDSRTDKDMKNVTTSSKKFLATSAAGNSISTKKGESSNDSSHDSGLDEDDMVQKAHVKSSSKKLLASAVAQRGGIWKNNNSYDGSREGFDECDANLVFHTMDAGMNQKKDEVVDATSTGSSRKEVPKTAFNPEKQNATSKKIFVGNLSYEVKRANLENLFKNCGEIVDVSFGLYRDGTFRGFAHVEFATEEAAQNALTLNGTELLRRLVKIEIAREKFAYIPNSRNNSLKGFQASLGEDEPTMSATSKEQNATSKMLFVGNLSYSVERDDLENLFKDCGEIVDIRFATDREGRFKGFAHVLFAKEEAAQIALMLNGNELLRRSLRLDLAVERGTYSHISSNRNASFHEYASLEGSEGKMPAAPKEQNATSKTVFVGNLSYSVERADLENLFKECGEIIDIRLATDCEGRFKGFGHVEFATQEAARNALKLNGNELLRQYVRLDLANEKNVHSSSSSIRGNRDDSGSVESQTVFVRGFDTSLREDEIRTRLEEHFSSCGIISKISIARDHGTGSTKGYAWLYFMDVDGFNKALELDGTEDGGYVLSVKKRRPRRYIQDGRGDSDQSGGWHGGGWGGGDQSGEWHGGGLWDHGRGYGQRWH